MCFKIGETGISIHALREEGDGAGLLLSTCKQLFLSTPSARRATARAGCCWQPPRDFYPRPPRGGRRKSMENQTVSARFLSTPSARRATAAAVPAVAYSSISIHALREEGDASASSTSTAPQNFYPRPPRGGRPRWPSSGRGSNAQFLSTPSARRATQIRRARTRFVQDFYPRPPRGGRPKPTRNDMHPTIFLSTPSARRATR